MISEYIAAYWLAGWLIIAAYVSGYLSRKHPRFNGVEYPPYWVIGIFWPALLILCMAILPFRLGQKTGNLLMQIEEKRLEKQCDRIKMLQARKIELDQAEAELSKELSA